MQTFMNDTMVRYFNVTIEPHVHTIKNGSYEFVALEKADIETPVRHKAFSLFFLSGNRTRSYRIMSTTNTENGETFTLSTRNPILRLRFWIFEFIIWQKYGKRDKEFDNRRIKKIHK